MNNKKVNIYLSSIPQLNLLNKATKSDGALSAIKNKVNILKDINTGLIKKKFKTNLITTHKYIKGDIHVLLGFIGVTAMKKKVSKNIEVRKDVIKKAEENNEEVLFIDSSLFKPYDKRDLCLRLSFNNVMRTTGDYGQGLNNININNKIKEIKNLYNFNLKDWNTEGNFILICLQREEGWSFKGNNTVKWVHSVLDKIGETKLKILLRPHPGAKYEYDEIVYNFPKLKIINAKKISLIENLQNCKAAIFFNSASSAASIIQGIPTFVTDIDSPAYEVANKNLRNIETPKIFDRQKWLSKIASIHWTRDELKNGDFIKAFSKYFL